MSGRPPVIAVGGFSSNCGKTTAVCMLLAALPGWEAVKVTKGHFRSCGKDPEACCVSGLLGDEPIVRSGRDGNFCEGKDTGRYWQAGASNVHWVIATKADVDAGLKRALGRAAPAASGVVVEGTGVIRRLDADFAIIAATPDQDEIKASTAAAMPFADAVLVTSPRPRDAVRVERSLAALCARRGFVGPLPPVAYLDEFDGLVAGIRARLAQRRSGTGPGDVLAPRAFEMR